MQSAAVQSGRQMADLEMQAKRLLAGAQVVSHFFAEYNRDYCSVLQYILQRGCSMIVMNTNIQQGALITGAVSLLAEKAGCPVLLVA